VVTRGPGAASAVNGVAQAQLDRQPLVLLADVVASAERPRTPHQLVDQRALFAPVANWSATLGGRGADRVSAAAVAVAGSTRRGPVHLDFDPTYAEVDQPPDLHVRATRSLPDDAVRLLRASRRPVVLLGVGALWAVPAVRALVLRSGAPVLASYRAKGVVPESWPEAAGVFTGAAAEAELLAEADLVLCVGFDAVEAIPGPWPTAAPVLALTAWPREDAYLPEHLEVVGDLAALVEQAARHLRSDERPPESLPRVEIRTALCALPPTTAGLHPAEVVEAVRRTHRTEASITVDAGAHMLVALALLEAERPREVLVSSGLATMGFAVPAAIGVALARPGHRVTCLTGDGGLGMVLAELETLARLRLPVTVVVFNDQALTLIELKQRETGQGGTGAVRYAGSDFVRIATALGVEAEGVDTVKDLEAGLVRAAARPGPSLLDVRVDPSTYVQVMRTLRGVDAGLRHRDAER
jgi:acetolactate synthase-1/2/3 large subunit